MWYKDKMPHKYRSVEANMVVDDLDSSDKLIYKVFYSQYKDWNTFKYKGKRLFLVKDKEKLENASKIETAHLEKYTISGFMCKKQLDQLLEEVVDYFNEYTNSKKRPKLHTNLASYRGSTKKDLGDYKSFDSIFFKGKDKLISELDKFVASEKLYKRMGIPFKKGIFLHGPPGTGKSATCIAIGKHLNRDVYTLDSATLESNSSLLEFFSKVKKKSCILIEDIDRTVMGNNKKKGERKGRGASMSTFFNCLDGPYSPQDCIIMMTSNHPDKLVDGLTRKGRFDISVCIDLPEKEQVEQYMTKFYKQDVKLKNYNAKVPMVDIQDICLNNDLELSINKIQQLC